SYLDGSLTVTPKALTITAANQSKTYCSTVSSDTSAPSSDFTVSGLVNGDTVTAVTLTSAGAAATATVAGSPYAIVASAASGSGLDRKSVGYVDGSLTVTPKALAVTAANQSKTYGTALTLDARAFTTSDP